MWRLAPMLLMLSLCACATNPSFCASAKQITYTPGDGIAIDAVAKIVAEIGDGCQGESGCQDTLAAIRPITGDTDKTVSQILDHNEQGSISCGWGPDPNFKP